MRPEPPEIVRVETDSADYTVTVGNGLLGELGIVVADAVPEARRVHLVVDSGVPMPLVATAADSLRAARLACSSNTITPSEPGKTAQTWQAILCDAANARLERTDAFVALGGGVIGDLAGFAAATYRRGVAVVQCPTTLLAMVDASVGGKTGINLEAEAGLLKNAVGSFHQPAAVLADTRALESLAPRVFRAGLAECVKHAMISGGFGDPNLGAFLDAARGPLGPSSAGLAGFIARNVAVKATVVRTDEREEAEADGRALLNLGHTFGHAIETIERLTPTGDPADAPLQHGEAVALGLRCAAELAEQLNMADGIAAKLVERLERAGLPTSIAGLPETSEILARMGHDKKAARGRRRFILPTGSATAAVIEDPPEHAVAAAVDSIRA